MRNLPTSLFHVAWTEKERSQLDDLIAFVEVYAGETFIADVCSYLHELIPIDGIMVSGHAKAPDEIQTIFFLHHGRPAPNFVYNYAASPCRHVVGQDLYYIPFGVQDFFPDDRLLKKLEGQSYLGMPLFDKQDQSLGLVVLVHQKLIEQAGFVEALLTVIVPRLEIEMLSLLSPLTWGLACPLEGNYC